jgi:diaminobutyrate-2-oxoglutarate transaminase
MTDGEHNFDELHFHPAPQIDGELPGERSRAMLAEQDELESSARSYPRSVPIAIEEGRGATMRDVDGNTFIDFFGGAGVLNVGHSHPAALAAAHEQEQKCTRSTSRRHRSCG